MKLVVTLLSMALLIGFSPAKAEVLRISIEPNNVFLEKLLPKLLETSGLDAKTVLMPSIRALKELNAGNIDANGLRLNVVEKTYPNILRMEEPVQSIDFIAITTNPNIEIANWADLHNFRVAYPAGWKIFELNVPSGPNVMIVKTQEQLFKLLNIGRVEVVLLSRSIAETLLKKEDVATVRFLNPPLHSKPAYLYFHKSKKEAAEKMSRSLKALKENGIYQEIYSHVYHIP